MTLTSTQTITTKTDTSYLSHRSKGINNYNSPANKSATVLQHPTSSYSLLPKSLNSTSKLSTNKGSRTSSSSSPPLRLAINNRWYDLTYFQHNHPGGAEILHQLHNQDATDAFFSLHSSDAIKRLDQLKVLSKPVEKGELEAPTAITQSFRSLREKLIKEGYFQRNIVWELFYHLSVYSLALFGTIAAYYNYSLLAIFCIGLSMQQAGWIGHDYVHGRGIYQYYMGITMSGFINAFSPRWWSNKHNTHHVYTNHVGVDLDIENDPIFHLWFPLPSNDVWYRRFQHIYFVPVAAGLFLSWRIQSLTYVIQNKKYNELLLMLPNYIWLYCLGLHISIPAIFLGGALVAVIVTATHQSEDMHPPIALSPAPYEFVPTQFTTTRDAHCDNFIMEWLWGGMQYQLEHHLFPTMPKYKYSQLRPILQEWAKSVNIEYRIDSVWEIWWRNYQTLKWYAGEEIHM